jgi:hypothetical protein
MNPSCLPLSPQTMDVQSFKNFHLLSFGSRCSAASSSSSLSSAPAESSYKKEYYYQTSKYLSCFVNLLFTEPVLLVLSAHQALAVVQTNQVR